MDGNLLTINGRAIKKLLKYEILYAKLWAEDTGRNMAGVMEGTLVGIFPKLQLEIGSCNESELAANMSLFNKSIVSVKYYDSDKKAYTTANFYSNDIAVSLRSQHRMKYNSYQVNLIPIRGR
ncbi:hypothetical protein LJC02_01920 [Breznakia sp. OttesenSCG-928-G09]|nr:hypothetical protein [Breznakia sp. OttesenSCG-928-G09]